MTIQTTLFLFLQVACSALAFVSSPSHSSLNRRLAFAPSSLKSPPSTSPLHPRRRKTRLYEYIPYEDRSSFDDNGGDDMDWRQFRAKLVLQEHGIERANEQQHQQWAYLQELLEPGAVLVHDDYVPKFMSNPYLYKSVLLVLQVGAKHTTCLILNRLANVTMHEDSFQATLFYGGKQDSFHAEDQQRIFCLHRCADCADVSDEIMSGLFLCSLEDAKMLHQAKRAQPADFLYISGYETLDTKELRKGIEVDKTWKSITIDAMTLQHALYQGSLDANAVHTHLLSMIGLRAPPGQEQEHPPPQHHQHPLHPSDRIENYLDDPNHTFIGTQRTTSMEDALLQEWQATQLHHGAARNKYASPPAHDIQEGDLLRASSQDHAFLFEHLECHKSIVLILEANEETCVGALLSYPTVETEPRLFDLPVRHGGSDDEGTYVLHYLGAKVGGTQIGQDGTFYMCTMEEAAKALERGVAQRHEFMVLRGKKVFDRQNDADSLSLVSPDLAPELFSLLNQQQPLNPLVVDHNVNVARDAWRLAGGKDGKEELRQLGEQATKAWVASHLLESSGPGGGHPGDDFFDRSNDFYNDFGPPFPPGGGGGPGGGLRP